MRLEDQVTNLELSSRLKELEVEQKSLFYWECLNENAYDVKFAPYTVCPLDTYPFKHFSAFTSDELMDLLPCFIDTKKDNPFNTFILQIYKRRAKNIQYSVKYICDTYGVDKYGNFSPVRFGTRHIFDKKLADSLAKMLIYLIEENLYVKLDPIDID